MINISKLTQKDIGRVVHYDNPPSNYECGVIKSWNQKYIFVIFFVVFSGGKPVRRFGQTAAATTPDQLTFAFDWENSDGL